MYTIHFGTSGWRDVIADGFTVERVKALARAIAFHVKAKRMVKPGVVVGYDPRFLSETFAQHAAELLSEAGITVYLVQEPTPTPVLAAAIRDLKLAGGINFTASHNPPQYQGLKWSNQHGGPATKQEVAPIETRANQFLKTPSSSTKPKHRQARIIPFNPKPGYFKRLAKMISLKVLRAARLRVVADPLYGAGRGYLDEALKMAGCQIEVLHDWRDPWFGGHSPEPNAENLRPAAQRMKAKHAVLTLGTDGDADRFGVVDRDGTFLTPNEVLALTVYLLVKHRGWRGRVVRSVVTSHLVDAVAKQYGLSVEVTPVGFKYIGESMQRPGFLVGGEESGGLTIVGHVPEKDGILACLLMAELVACEQKSLRAVLKNIYQQVGTFVTHRINLQLDSPLAGEKIKHALEKTHPGMLAGQRVVQCDRTDGFKYLLANGDWLAIRLSGTEPVARLYLETHAAQRLAQLKKAGSKLLGQI